MLHACGMLAVDALKGQSKPYVPCAACRASLVAGEFLRMPHACGTLCVLQKPYVSCVARRVSLVAEEFLRMLHACGMPATDADMIHGSGATVGGLLMQASSEPCSLPLLPGRTLAGK